MLSTSEREEKEERLVKRCPQSIRAVLTLDETSSSRVARGCGGLAGTLDNPAQGRSPLGIPPEYKYSGETPLCAPLLGFVAPRNEALPHVGVSFAATVVAAILGTGFAFGDVAPFGERVRVL